jgi:glycosyltransferase involved in cell wall biosynthesis
MKVLMMHRGDGAAGGAQVQMNRLRAGLGEQGVEANILCREGGRSGSVLMPYQKFAEKWIRRVTRRIGLNDIELISSFKVADLAEVQAADVLDLHCLHSGAFSYLALPALTANKPTLFTFHDMWPITGHCHASLECGRWKTGCGSCPHLDVQPSIQRDATAFEWKLKKWAYQRSKFTIVTPSKWLCEMTRQSMLAGSEVHHIPHGVDQNVFEPLDRAASRSALGIPANRKVLLCAMDSQSRPLKGAHYLPTILNALPESLAGECVLLLFGTFREEILKEIRIPVIHLGLLNNDRVKAIAYSSADILVYPSEAESFGLVVLESMACGTPVASFSVGGVPELVRDGVTGRLVSPNQPSLLGAAIVEMLGDPAGLRAMSARCRAMVLGEYTLALQVSRYIKLYKSVINGRLKIEANYPAKSLIR